ncbi:CMGC/SRPK protein kinase [Capronia epimyces CBS 606.96]|uniref:non-specific serine/threonine protein kinase n=1 Tax=Capronia epimyces CBS 606.96 TaxID=1182542 RepID=W9XTW2_9EURO|nr:CMGC/SRPK protein kinase [Capronia epimyces CBS 606.96]EXJ83982.1 CMGC/SRPK protein kinase [Capronia epimyces CBS 606.96]
MAYNDSYQQIEEGTLPLFHQKRYYPVKIGNISKQRYRIIAKLGYGAYSTVWLARDEIETDHPGLDFTRLALDIFEIDGPHGRPCCIATKPQGSSLRALQEILPDAILPRMMVKSLVHRLWFSVNWLHATCGVVHTDISPQNVLTAASDEIIFKNIEEQESQDPGTPIMNDGVPIYRSRSSIVELSGIPILTDFGQMRLADPMSNDWWMPDLYRAPEVLLKLPWAFPVDVWSVGVMTLKLLERRNLFDPIDREHNQYVLPLALSQYIGYLGPPPLEMIKRSPLFRTYFDQDGNWISEPPIPETSLENFLTTVPPGEEKEMLLKFIRKILTWDPEVRATSSEILEDEWLMRPVDDIM